MCINTKLNTHVIYIIYFHTSTLLGLRFTSKQIKFAKFQLRTNIKNNLTKDYVL